MTPIHDIIHRIIWDTDYGNADFVIGYYDRVFKRIVRVSFERIRMERGQHFGFDLIGRDGEVRMVPFTGCARWCAMERSCGGGRSRCR